MVRGLDQQARRDSAEVTRSRRGVLTLTIHMVRNNSLLGEGVRVSLPNSRQPERLRTMAAPDQRRDGVTHYSYGEGEGPQKRGT